MIIGSCIAVGIIWLLSFLGVKHFKENKYHDSGLILAFALFYSFTDPDKYTFFADRYILVIVMVIFIPVFIVSVIFLFLPYLLFFLVEKLYIKHKNEISIRNTVIVRKIIQVSSLIIIGYFFIEFLILMFQMPQIFQIVSDEEFSFFYKLYFFIFVIAIVATIPVYYMILQQCLQPVYYSSVIDKLDDYILYLRAFKDDVYSYKDYKKLKRLDENKIVKAFKHIFPVYAIGQPNKLLPSVGAKRIYITEEEWKDGVKKLAKKAKIIILNVSNTENFLWETEFCIKNIDKNKLFFFCNNENKIYYIQFQKYMNLNCQVQLPEYKSEYDDKNIIIYFENHIPIFKSFLREDNFQYFINEFYERSPASADL